MRYLLFFAVATLAACASALPVTISQSAAPDNIRQVKLTVSEIYSTDAVVCGLFLTSTAAPTDNNLVGNFAMQAPVVDAVQPFGVAVFTNVDVGQYHAYCWHMSDSGDDASISGPVTVEAVPTFSFGTPTFEAAGAAKLAIERDLGGDWEANTVVGCLTSLDNQVVDSGAFWGGVVPQDISSVTAPVIELTGLQHNKHIYVQCAVKIGTVSSAFKFTEFDLAPANPSVTVANDKGKVTVTVGRADFPGSALAVSKIICLTQVPATTVPSLNDIRVSTATTKVPTGYTVIDDHADVATATSRALVFDTLNPGTGKVYCAFGGDTSDDFASADIDIQVVELTVSSATSPTPGTISVTVKRDDNANFDAVQGSVTCLVTPDSETLVNAATGNTGIWNGAVFSTIPAAAGYRVELNTLTGDAATLSFNALAPNTYNVYCSFKVSSGSAVVAGGPVDVTQDIAIGMVNIDHGRVVVTVVPAIATNFRAEESTASCSVTRLPSASVPASLSDLWSLPTAYSYNGNYRVESDSLPGSSSAAITFPRLAVGTYKLVCGFPTTTNSRAVVHDVDVDVTKATTPTVTAAPRPGTETSELTLAITTAADYGTVQCVISKNAVSDADLWTTSANPPDVLVLSLDPIRLTTTQDNVETGPGKWNVKCAWQNSDVASIASTTVDVACPAGQGVASGSCGNCDAGKYSQYPTSNVFDACVGCTAPKTTASTGADGADDCVCPRGYKNDGDGGCTQCSVGTYADTLDAADCTACGEHETSPLGSTGVGACRCEDGYELEGAECQACEPNFYSTGGTACQPCPGQTISAAAAASCACAVGHVHDEGDDSCTACVANQQLVNNVCFPCDGDNFSPPASEICCQAGYGVVNGNACQVCTANQYSTDGLCHNCDSGKFSSQGSTSVDQCCPDNSAFVDTACVCYDNHEADAGECVACDTGKYSTGGAACQICPENQFLDGTSCLDCPANHYSAAGSYAIAHCCFANATWVAEKSACVCNPGFQKLTNQDICDPCPAGQWAINGSACAACAENQYLNAGVCTDCPAGKHSVAGAASAAQCCVEHSDWVTGAGACVCAAGYELNNIVCTACSAGKYRKAAQTNSVCAFCPLNTFYPTTGRATDCLPCPGGLYSGEALNLATTTCHCNATGTWVALTSVNDSASCLPKNPLPEIPSASWHVAPTMGVVVALLLALFTAF